MERSLDPDLLRLALGQHANLPTPEELSELMAQAELAILVGNPQMSEDMLAVGWYLHGVATSDYALRTYGVERQRAAFQVAGHLFDLVLQSREMANSEMLKYAFAAQIAYIRGDLDPNAIAIYRRIRSLLAERMSLVPDFYDIALSCGVALLGFDVGYVFPVTRGIRREISETLSNWGVDDILSTPFGAAANTAMGVRDIMTFLVYGRSDRLERARTTLRSAVLADAPTQDQISRWVAAHLLRIADDLGQSSIWTALPPEVPPGIRKAFTLGTPRMLTLWPPQLDLLGTNEPNAPNPLSSQAKRLIISTPTSGGKTTVSQILIASHLAIKHSSVCYVAPTRTLCREVRKSLENRFRYLSFEVADDIPEDAWWDQYLQTPPAVEVMTPERLSFLVRSDPSRVLDRFGMYVFDEVHLVGEKGRGWKLEATLTYLHHATLNSEHRIALISAAIGNKNHFIQWMDIDGSEPLYKHSVWRGPRRLSAIFTTEPDWANSSLQPKPRAHKNRVQQVTPLYGRLRVRISHTGNTKDLRTTASVGDLVRHGPDEHQLVESDQSTTPFYKRLLPIIEHLASMGSVLVIESTKPAALHTAKAIAETRPASNDNELLGLADLVRTHLGDHPLADILRKGVGYHHGSLPTEIRSAIEDAVVRGSLRILVATTTMTEGVNLPVQSVVISKQGAYTQKGNYEKFITGPRLINAIGRAGRATKETEGIVVLAQTTAPSPSDFDQLNPSDDRMQIISMLAQQGALEDLTEFEAVQQQGQDLVFEGMPQVASDFLQFVWFLAAEMDKLGQPATLESVQNVLRHSLGWLQTDANDQTRWISAANRLLHRFNATDPVVRRRWAAAGTSLVSASQLEAIARELVDRCKQIQLPDKPALLIRVILENGRLNRILNLPEAPTRGVFDRRAGRGRNEILVPLDDLLDDWLQGVSLNRLADTYFAGVSDVDFRYEQLGNYLNEYIETFLPWVVGTIVTWANSILLAEGNGTQLPTDLPAYIRYGVSNPISLHLMIQGILSRTLAERIAAVAVARGTTGELRAWIRSMDLSELRQAFDATPAELRSLLEYARDRTGGIVAGLLNNGRVLIEMNSLVADHPTAKVDLIPEDETELPSIKVLISDSLVAQIPTQLRREVASILSSGLEIDARFSAKSGKGILEINLVEPE